MMFSKAFRSRHPYVLIAQFSSLSHLRPRTISFGATCLSFPSVGPCHCSCSNPSHPSGAVAGFRFNCFRRTPEIGTRVHIRGACQKIGTCHMLDPKCSNFVSPSFLVFYSFSSRHVSNQLKAISTRYRVVTLTLRMGLPNA